MTARRLIDLFGCFTKLPVDVVEIRDQIVEWGYYQRIVLSPFYGPESDILGNVLVYRSHAVYGGDEEICIVRYNGNVSKQWQRLICAKELVHCIDSEKLRVDSKEKFEALLDAMPIGRLNQAVISLAALFEEVATYQALAILCPEGALEKLRLGVSEGRYSQQEVSAILDVPEEHARLVMTEMWQPFIETLKAASI